MFSLLTTTISLGLVDSLNPFSLSMQFMLQGLVKKPRHIWYFIIAIILTNFTAGIFAYYGLISILVAAYDYFITNHQVIIILLELLIALILMVYMMMYLMNQRKERHRTQAAEEEKKAKKIRSVTPQSLFILGIGTTLSEITTALPYFAFLGILFTADISLSFLILLMILYNLVYAGPMIALYVVYILANKQFNSIYRIINQLINRFSSILMPIILLTIAIGLVWHVYLQI